MTRLSKVLKNGMSAHGGAYTWSLPVPDGEGWAPGEWSPRVEDPHICHYGYHLTSDPMRWPVAGMTVYDAEGEDEGAQDAEPDKHVFARARLLRPSAYAIPAYWRAVEAFVASIPGTPWFQPDGDPDPAWRLVERADWASAWGAAWGAARDAARGAARNAAWGAARDAALVAAIRVGDGLTIAPEHAAHAEARWSVWRKGYALLCDINGTLIVYAGNTGGAAAGRAGPPRRPGEARR